MKTNNTEPKWEFNHAVEAIRSGSHCLFSDHPHNPEFIRAILKAVFPEAIVTKGYDFRSNDKFFFTKAINQWFERNFNELDLPVINLSEIKNVSETESFLNGELVECSDIGHTEWRNNCWFVGMTRTGLFVCENETGGIHYWKYCRRPQIPHLTKKQAQEKYKIVIVD